MYETTWVFVGWTSGLPEEKECLCGQKNALSPPWLGRISRRIQCMMESSLHQELLQQLSPRGGKTVPETWCPGLPSLHVHLPTFQFAAAFLLSNLCTSAQISVQTKKCMFRVNINDDDPVKETWIEQGSSSLPLNSIVSISHWEQTVTSAGELSRLDWEDTGESRVFRGKRQPHHFTDRNLPLVCHSGSVQLPSQKLCCGISSPAVHPCWPSECCNNSRKYNSTIFKKRQRKKPLDRGENGLQRIRVSRKRNREYFPALNLR